MITYAEVDWRPKYTASAHATGLRTTLTRCAPGACTGTPRSRASGSHAGTASAATTAHAASPSRQSPNAAVIGTVAAAAAVAPTFSATVYSPVMAPIRSGNRSLTITGSSTFTSAIPASATALSSTNTT